MTAAPPRTVLFLDDEKSYVELMTQLLSGNLDCPVVGYTRPAEALADLPRLGVALIVTDYSMPGMDGLDFLRRAQAQCPQAVALIITGQQLDVDDDALAEVPGLRETMFKPVTWQTLADRIIRYWPDGNPPKLRGDASPA